MCGKCSQCLGHTGFSPAYGMCAFLVYTAQAPGYSAEELSKVGPGLSALPRSKPLRFKFSGMPQRHRLGWVCILYPSQVRAAQVTRCWRAHSPRWTVRLITSPVPAVWFPRGPARALSQPCVSWAADLRLRPSWQMSTIQDPRKNVVSNWEPAHSLVEDASLWSRDWSSPLPSGSGCHPPASLPPGGGWAGPQPACSPLVFT